MTSTKTASKAPAKAGSTPKATRPCHCGCGTQTGGTFAQGHDARFVSLLVRRFEQGEITRQQAQAAAAKISDKLGAKAARSLELAAGRKATAKTAKAPRTAKADEADETATAEPATDARDHGPDQQTAPDGESAPRRGLDHLQRRRSYG